MHTYSLNILLLLIATTIYDMKICTKLWYGNKKYKARNNLIRYKI